MIVSRSSGEAFRKPTGDVRQISDILRVQLYLRES